MDTAIVVGTVVAAVASASIGGVFLAFSTFIMRGLGQLAPPHGIRAMQAINVTAVTPVFMAVLFGTALLSVVLTVVALVSPTSATPWRVAAAVSYVVGVIVVTAAFHVPRNNALAKASPDGTDGAALWKRYLVGWVRGNHVRMLAALASSALWILSLLPRVTG